MWMTREEIADTLGIVVNSVRGKVQKGQVERRVVDGKNLYRIVDPNRQVGGKGSESAGPTRAPDKTTVRPEPKAERRTEFNPKEVLLDQLSSMKVERNIDAIEKGDEIDLATGELSRELEVKISMRQQKQVKEIQEALERLKQGEYGICEECGDTIPEQRLRLFPAAKFCVRCQEEADSYEKLKGRMTPKGAAWKDDASEGAFGKAFDD